MYNRKLNDKYVKEHIPKDRLSQFVSDIKLDLIKEVEMKAERLILEKIGEYGADIFEGNTEAFDEFRVWLSAKKVEVQNDN